MQLTSISWVKNEGDVIEAFVRHHSRLLDRMIIIDHKSMDDTRGILESLQREGLPIEIRSDHSVTHRQGAALTDLLHELGHSSNDADWIFPLDADEFIVDSASDMRARLIGFTSDKVLHLPWRTYVPTPQDDATEMHPLKRIRHRRSTEDPQWYKIAIPVRLLKERTWTLPEGNHVLFDPKTSATASGQTIATLSLAHFPVRSSNQIRSKIFSHWLRHRSHPGNRPGTGYQWKALFDQLTRSKDMDAETLQLIAQSYATRDQWNALDEAERQGTSIDTYVFGAQQKGKDSLVFDPVRSENDLRYAHVPLDPLTVLAQTAEEIAAAYAEIAETLQNETR